MASKSSNLGSTRAILLDSLLDLIYPITSMMAIYSKQLDNLISCLQFLLIIGTTLYFTIVKFNEKAELVDRPTRTMLFMVISSALSVICIGVTKGLISNSMSVLSLKVILTHFQIDLISKLCVIFITLLNKLNIPLPHKRQLTQVLDLGSMGLIVFTAFRSFYIFVSGGLN